MLAFTIFIHENRIKIQNVLYILIMLIVYKLNLYVTFSLHSTSTIKGSFFFVSGFVVVVVVLDDGDSQLIVIEYRQS